MGKDYLPTNKLLNAFLYKGPYGDVFCIVFEVLGVNLREVMHRSSCEGLSISFCKKFAKKLLLALDFTHRISGIIHTNIKPENIMISISTEKMVY